MENKKLYLDIKHRFVLNESDRSWLVLSGEVNVFYTQIDGEGKYLTPLKLLFSAKKGNLIFSLLPKDTTDNIRLILFSNRAVVLPIKKEDLHSIDSLLLKSMLHKWIVKTATALNPDYPPRRYIALNQCGKTVLKKDENAYPSRKIRWISLKNGSIKAYAGTTLFEAQDKPEVVLPVFQKLWIQSVLDKTEIKIHRSDEVLSDQIDTLMAIQQLEVYFYNTLKECVKKNKEAGKAYVQKKIENENSQLNRALQKIKAIVDPGSIYRSEQSSGAESSLFQTCQFIGKQVGFSVVKPKDGNFTEATILQQLRAIAKTSTIWVRKVILRDTWWKQENGHLLAFRKSDGKPMALIQNQSKSSYHLYAVSEGTDKVEVDDTVAQEIEPVAYMFFSGFKQKMSKVKDVLRFAVQGLEKDLKFLILAALSGSLAGLLVPVFSGIMFDDVIPTADRSLHFEIFAMMLITGLVIAGLQLVQALFQLRIETRSGVQLQAGVMDHLLRLPTKFYKKYTSGDLTNRVLSINAIRRALSDTLLTAVLSGCFSLVNLVLLFYYDSKLAWVGVLLGVLAMAFMIGIGFLKLKYDRKISDQDGELQGFLFEFLSGISKIRISGGENRIFSLWAEKFARFKRLGFKSGAYQNFVATFNASYPLLTSMVFFSVIYYTILHGDASTRMISVGAFMAFITAFNKFLDDALRLSRAFIVSLNVVPLYERVKPIMEAEPESDEKATDPGELAGDIEMNSVSFRYDADQPLVLKDISFKIKQGEMVAFVGSSGSGKSTIMRLLLGFEQPEKGSVFYDKETFETMNKELVRKQIGVVLQNGALMSGSIYQNIIGNSELTLDDAWEAARMAGMEEDIKQMPMEMHTVVSEGAGTFSGGQRQRLMIARAIVHKPRMLFMDEATSALDNRTQQIVADSLDRLQATRIVIAHRLSTIKNADRIYVLDRGEIVETGTYATLMKSNGVFKRLAERQIVEAV